VAIFSLLYIAVNSFLIYNGNIYGNAIPVLLIAGVWVFFAPVNLFYALVLFAPLSITLRRIVPGLAFDFWFPTEPMLVFLLLMMIIKSFKERYFQKELLNHPVFISILIYLGWILIAIFASEMPIVSIKYFLVRFWFIGIFFYLAFILFRSDENNFIRFFWLYVTGLFVVVVFALIKHAGRGLLDHDAAHSASAPFFIDHTSYGAALAFIIPLVFAQAINIRIGLVKVICWVIGAIFIGALLLSYSRAAWLSLIFGASIGVLIILKIRFRTIISVTVIVAAVLLMFSDNILWLLKRNTTDSSGDLVEHVQSIVNISSDASNLERINRWDAAISMFAERPMFGWGPGTYQFLYAPFQKSYNKTIISTNFGTGGNAHSEYLGLMSESGFIAALGYVLILFFALYRGLKLLPKVSDKRHRNIVVACIVGLITYVFHGFLNNFLDADKIAVLFWGFIALIVAMDVKYSKSIKQVIP
jgi:O-antigen ligase